MFVFRESWFEPRKTNNDNGGSGSNHEKRNSKFELRKTNLILRLKSGYDFQSHIPPPPLFRR